MRFRSADLASAGVYFQALASPDLADLPFEVARAADNRALITLALAALVFVLPRSLRMPAVMEGGDLRGLLARCMILGAGYPYALVLVVAGAFTAFIYFQF